MPTTPGKPERTDAVGLDVTTQQPVAASQDHPATHVDVLVIGAGQAGLSAAYHLRRRGYTPLDITDSAATGTDDVVNHAGTYVVLDAEDGPGGAWRHRWDTLTMGTVNGIHDLPGMARPQPSPQEQSNRVLPEYFGDFEHTYALGIRRPAPVKSVEFAGDGPDAPLRATEDSGQVWRCRVLINATGTWRSPMWPIYPGQADFAGRQLHTADYRGPQEFAGKHVVVIGGGISAIQHLQEISEAGATTTWVTRREPVFRDLPFDAEAGREAVEMVERRVRAGLPPKSVVSVTGLPLTPAVQRLRASGVLEPRPMFDHIEPDGVRWSDGTFQRADVLLWATGFRAHLGHLAPLRLRGSGGGIQMDGTQVAGEPRVHLIGYGPSSSTVGANRAGRDAVREIHRWMSERAASVA